MIERLRELLEGLSVRSATVRTESGGREYNFPVPQNWSDARDLLLEKVSSEADILDLAGQNLVIKFQGVARRKGRKYLENGGDPEDLDQLVREWWAQYNYGASRSTGGSIFRVSEYISGDEPTEAEVAVLEKIEEDHTVIWDA